MKSLFLPAIKLMHRLTYPFKFAVIGGLALIAIVVLFVPRAINQYHTITTSQFEVIGLHTNKTLLRLVQQLQQHRGLSAAVLSGTDNLKETLANKANDVQQAIQAVNDIVSKRGSQLAITDAWKKMNDKWENIRTEGYRMSPTDNFVAHTKLIGDTRDLIETIGEKSGLSLEHETVNYYLTAIAMSELPAILEDLGKLRGQGAAVLTQKSLNEITKKAFIENTAILRIQRDRLEKSFTKIATSDPSLTQVTTDFSKEFHDATNRILLIVAAEIIGNNFSTAPKTYFDQVTQTIDAGYTHLYDGLLPTLENRLLTRIADTQRNFYLETSLYIAVILLFVYFATGAYLAIISNLNSLKQSAETIASGNFTTHIHLNTRDELHDVADRFNHMITAISKLIASIRAESSQVSSAAASLATSSDQLSTSSARQNEAAASMAAAIEEMTVSVDEINRHAQEAQSISQSSGELSSQGNEVVNTTAKEMSSIADTVNISAQIIQELGKESEKISTIVNAIKEIADQTNLLALNAAIEAARAGESGRGFAVVADEVRKLAERTAKATQEIGEMIAVIQHSSSDAVRSMQEGVSRVGQGVELAHRAGESMEKITHGAHQVVQVIGDISIALKEQSAASQDIAQNVEQIARMADENHAAVGKTTATAKELERLSRSLQKEIERFRIA